MEASPSPQAHGHARLASVLKTYDCCRWVRRPGHWTIALAAPRKGGEVGTTAEQAGEFAAATAAGSKPATSMPRRTRFQPIFGSDCADQPGPGRRSRSTYASPKWLLRLCSWTLQARKVAVKTTGAHHNLPANALRQVLHVDIAKPLENFILPLMLGIVMAEKSSKLLICISSEIRLPYPLIVA